MRNRSVYGLIVAALLLTGCAGQQNIGKDLGDLGDTEAQVEVATGSGITASTWATSLNANDAELYAQDAAQDLLIAANTLKVGLAADTVTPLMLVSDNALVDEYCFTYESSTGNFEMQVCGSGAGDDLGSAVYSDVVALWTTCTSGVLLADGTCAEVVDELTTSDIESLTDDADLTPGSITMTPVSEPEGGLADADSGDEDQGIFQFWADATTTTAGAVVSDVGLSYKDGTDPSGDYTDFLVMDGSEGELIPKVPLASEETISGRIVTGSETGAHTLTEREYRGANVWAGSAGVYSLPSAQAGFHGCIEAEQGVEAVIELLPASGDYIVHNGGRGTVATSIKSAGDLGDRICYRARGTSDWYVSVYGTWAE